MARNSSPTKEAPEAEAVNDEAVNESGEATEAVADEPQLTQDEIDLKNLATAIAGLEEEKSLADTVIESLEMANRTDSAAYKRNVEARDALIKKIESKQLTVTNIKALAASRERMAPVLEQLHDRDFQDNGIRPGLRSFADKMTIVFTDLPKNIQLLENEIATRRARLDVYKMASAATESLGDGAADLPNLTVSFESDEQTGDNVLRFAPTTRRYTGTSTKSTAGDNNGTSRGSNSAYRIISSEVRPELNGVTVGNVDGATYKSWQELYEAVADAETRKKIDSQSRSKRQWAEKALKLKTEAIES